MNYKQLRCADSGAVLVAEVLVPQTFAERARGLLGRGVLAPQQSMMLMDCRAIHMFGMRFAIDAVYVDVDWNVVKVVPGLSPWRISACHRAKHVVELAAGAAGSLGLTQGRRLALCGN